VGQGSHDAIKHYEGELSPHLADTISSAIIGRRSIGKKTEAGFSDITLSYNALSEKEVGEVLE